MVTAICMKNLADWMALGSARGGKHGKSRWAGKHGLSADRADRADRADSADRADRAGVAGVEGRRAGG